MTDSHRPAAPADTATPENPGTQRDDALRAPPIILNPGTEYHGPARLWQGIPGLERAANGRLWATWYTGGDNEGPFNHVVLVTSENDGKSWSKPVLAIDPPGRVRAYDPVLWIDPVGTLWLFWAQSYEGYDGRAGVWAITTRTPDSPSPTWSAPRRIADGIMMNKPTVTRAGRWLFPIAVWVNSGPGGSGPAKDGLIRRPAVYVSDDHGKTITRLGDTDLDKRTYDEHMIVERNDGSLWMLLRTLYGIGESFSRDGGVTWSYGQPSSIPAPCSRFFIRRLASGRLLLVNHVRFANTNPADRWDNARKNLAAMLSDDDGKTWPYELMLDMRFRVSYPDGVQDSDGVIRVIYDRGRVREKEILMARFTEADILAGKLVTPGSRIGMIIDNAT